MRFRDERQLAAMMAAAADAATPGRWQYDEHSRWSSMVSDRPLEHDDGRDDGYGGRLIAESLRAPTARYLEAAQPDHVRRVAAALETACAELDRLHEVLEDHREALTNTRQMNADLVERLDQLLDR